MLFNKLQRFTVSALIFSSVTAYAAENNQSNLGSELYHDYCSVCHGDTGKAAVWAQSGLSPSPRNFTTRQSKEELGNNKKRMIFSVTYGRPQTAMQGWGKRLRPYEIEAMVDYIRLNFMNITEEPVEPDHTDVGAHDHSRHFGEDMNSPIPDGLLGDYQKGKDLFENSCVPCHGDKGDGEGPRSRFIFPKPRDFKHPAALAKYSRPHLYNFVHTGRRGTEMPAWRLVLSDQQIADVVEYVFKAFIRPPKEEK